MEKLLRDYLRDTSDKLYQINKIFKATENVKSFFVVFFRQ